MHTFGKFRGELTPRDRWRVDAIAHRHGAELVTYVDPGCQCGKGCRPLGCPKAAASGWFTHEDCGEPINSDTASAVVRDLALDGFRLDFEDPVYAATATGVDRYVSQDQAEGRLTRDAYSPGDTEQHEQRVRRRGSAPLRIAHVVLGKGGSDADR